MVARQNNCLSHVLVTVLLLGDWTADGAHNDSERVSSMQLANIPSSRNIVVKEGSSTLIKCNVTGDHDDIKWFNSKGHLVGEGAGGMTRSQSPVGFCGSR